MRKQPIVPETTVTIFNLGEHCKTTVAGDLILVKHAHISAKAIRLGQRIKYWMLRVIMRRKEYENAFCEANHAMTVVVGGRHALVSQMQPGPGGKIVSLENYVDLKYAVVHTIKASIEQRANAVQVGNWCVGNEYGWLSIIAMIIGVFVPFFEISMGIGNSMVCSTAATLAQRCMGLIPDEADVGVFPADDARYYNVRL
jgi:hypothetical protein